MKYLLSTSASIICKNQSASSQVAAAYCGRGKPVFDESFLSSFFSNYHADVFVYYTNAYGLQCKQAIISVSKQAHWLYHPNINFSLFEAFRRYIFKQYEQYLIGSHHSNCSLGSVLHLVHTRTLFTFMKDSIITNKQLAISAGAREF